MNLDSFDLAAYWQLLTYVSKRNITFFDSGPGIIIRHDVDDNLEAAVDMAELEKECGVRATYFILNTSPYWSRNLWDLYRYIRSLGHEIAWHNNVITQFIRCDGKMPMPDLIRSVLKQFSDNGFNIRGSASHGDSMCYKYNYVNYQVWDRFPKTGLNGKCKIQFDQVKMEDFGLEYEAYAVGQDVYLSESGKKWRSEIKESDLENPNNRVQILTHCQHWKL